MHKLCEISVQICNLNIGPLSHLNDFHVFPCDSIRYPFTLRITQSFNIVIHFHLPYKENLFVMLIPSHSHRVTFGHSELHLPIRFPLS